MGRTTNGITFSDTPYFLDRGRNGTAQPLTERVNVGIVRHANAVLSSQFTPQPHSRPVVSYYAPKDIGLHHYGERHPMKPHRLALTNALVVGYGLDKQIHNMYDARPATQAELEMYHDHDYIEFLSKVGPKAEDTMQDMMQTFNCGADGEDCPIFADMYDFCRLYTGASIAAARKLAAGTSDIAINWSGGLHHAKRGEASGFCYINDIVLAILELLRYHPRVLYIDIDIHHGDGVEFAFYHSNRVMTVSFHKYTGDFFPGTGKLEDNGHGLGKYFSLNVPLLDGVDDAMYLDIFKTVIGETMSTFRPSSTVLQCGADSLGADRLGAFNLSIKAHGECVDFVKRFNLPLLILGGGGYTIKNVARCWTYETAVCVGADIPNELPATMYDAFFQDSKWKLHPPLTQRVENHNKRANVEKMKIDLMKKLRYLQGAPSIAMQEIPPDIEGFLDCEERNEEEMMEEDGYAVAGEGRIDHSKARNEFYDGDQDNDRDGSYQPGRILQVKPATTRRASTRSTRGRAPIMYGAEEDSNSKRAGVIKRPARGGRARGVGQVKVVEDAKDGSEMLEC